MLAGLVVSVAAERPIFTKNQKAFYLTEQELAFIRPGLVVKIVDVSIDEDGTIKARFTATDPRGLPLDRTGVFTPGPVSTSFVVAVIPKGEVQNFIVDLIRSILTSIPAERTAGELSPARPASLRSQSPPL